MTTGFDNQLRAALSADDEAFLKRLEEERGLFAQLGDAFHGPMRYWTAFAVVLSLAMFGLSIYALFQIVDATADAPRTIWLAVFLWSSIGVGLVKVWFWMRMNHLATLRELKKIELMIARTD